MTFKVVCIDDRFAPRGHPCTDINGRTRNSNGDSGGLTKGAVYTVIEVRRGDYATAYVLAEIKREDEPGFRASRFRPLVDSRKSVSFTAGAPKDSEKWDNRKVVSPRHRVRVNG